MLDQFGVLHDGRQPYSAETLRAVKAMCEDAKLSVFIISNSSRRSSGTIKKLQRLGFDSAWFSGRGRVPSMTSRRPHNNIKATVLA